MEMILISSSILSLLGGMFFGLFVEGLLPVFGVPRVTVRITMTAMITVATLFWTTWIFPQMIMMVIIERPLTLSAIISVIFILYIIGLLISTFIIGKIKKVD